MIAARAGISFRVWDTHAQRALVCWTTWGYDHPLSAQARGLDPGERTWQPYAAGRVTTVLDGNVFSITQNKT